MAKLMDIFYFLFVYFSFFMVILILNLVTISLTSQRSSKNKYFFVFLLNYSKILFLIDLVISFTIPIVQLCGPYLQQSVLTIVIRLPIFLNIFISSLHLVKVPLISPLILHSNTINNLQVPSFVRSMVLSFASSSIRNGRCIQ